MMMTDAEFNAVLKAVSVHIASLRSRIARIEDDAVRATLQDELDVLVSARNTLEDQRL